MRKIALLLLLSFPVFADPSQIKNPDIKGYLDYETKELKPQLILELHCSAKNTLEDAKRALKQQERFTKASGGVIDLRARAVIGQQIVRSGDIVRVTKKDYQLATGKILDEAECAKIEQ
jgi:hypothetical protein